MRIRFEEYSPTIAPIDSYRGSLTRTTFPDRLTIALPRRYNDRVELAKLIAFGARWSLKSPKGETMSSTAVMVAGRKSLYTPMGGEVAMPDDLKRDETILTSTYGTVLDEIIQAFDEEGRVQIEYDVKYPGWNFTRKPITIHK